MRRRFLRKTRLDLARVTVIGDLMRDDEAYLEISFNAGVLDEEGRERFLRCVARRGLDKLNGEEVQMEVNSGIASLNLKTSRLYLTETSVPAGAIRRRLERDGVEITEMRIWEQAIRECKDIAYDDLRSLLMEMESEDFPTLPDGGEWTYGKCPECGWESEDAMVDGICPKCGAEMAPVCYEEESEEEMPTLRVILETILDSLVRMAVMLRGYEEEIDKLLDGNPATTMVAAAKGYVAVKVTGVWAERMAMLLDETLKAPAEIRYPLKYRR
ncbi:hypothetical protein DRP77_09965 [Candidatus Poribacteria bacterium]|mgnify:FL=1|nr:MAG: hypothetical protein DRP77_09965 [Candidatus Poribacteria bacterium]